MSAERVWTLTDLSGRVHRAEGVVSAALDEFTDAVCERLAWFREDIDGDGDPEDIVLGVLGDLAVWAADTRTLLADLAALDVIRSYEVATGVHTWTAILPPELWARLQVAVK